MRRISSRHRWEAFRRQALAYYGDICWICGCGGARQVDHVEPVTEDDARKLELSNVRPAHGAPGNPCVQCSAACGRNIYCNQLRGAMSAERARRIITERAEAYARTGKVPERRATGYTAARKPAREAPPEGRAW